MSDFTDAVLANAEAMRKAQEKIARLEARIAELELERDDLLVKAGYLGGQAIAREEKLKARVAELTDQVTSLTISANVAVTQAMKAEARCEALTAALPTPAELRRLVEHAQALCPNESSSAWRQKGRYIVEIAERLKASAALATPTSKRK
jgi:chromosome segregation ATPase